MVLGYCMLGQHPPAPQEEAPGQGAPDPQAKSFEPLLPIPMPPMRDISFSVFLDSQAGQGSEATALLETISSNVFPHSVQRYS
jgi:hypothetical protein